MNAAPEFFVPYVEAEQSEQIYATLAELASRTVPPLNARVYSITFHHDGVEWTATVGEQLHGIERRQSRKQRAQSRQTGLHCETVRHHSDPAEVLAIFAGVPFIVVTNARIGDGRGSAWVNPFMAGKPNSVSRFRERSSHTTTPA